MDDAMTPVMDAGSRDATVAAPNSTAEPAAEVAVLQELLIEEISIDGMCGVY